MRKFLLLLALLLVPATGFSQKIQAVPTQISVGAGSMFGDEEMTFSWDGFFGAIHWHGVEIANGEMTSGVGIEIHPATVISFSDGSTHIHQIGDVDFRVWSLNRLKMSALQIPGEIWEEMYIGTDLLLIEGGTDHTGDFTARLVFGVQEKAGPGWIDLEIYMFEKYRPISFAMFYRYDF